MALPGILTGLILALSRAIGETAPLITIGALTYIPFAPDSIWSPFTVLPIQIFNWVSRPQADVQGQRRRRHPRAAGAAADHERDRHRRPRSLAAPGTCMTDVHRARQPRRASPAAPASRRRRSISPSRSTSSGSTSTTATKRALDGIDDRDPRQPRDRVHRPVGLRQEHVPAHAQPDERHHPGDARRGHGADRRRVDLRRRASTSSQLRRRVGMVFQKSNPFPKSIFENVAYGLRINGMAEVEGRAGRARRGEPAPGGDLGRSEGPAARVGAGAVGRPAAAAVHRARAGDPARRSC